MTTAQALQCRKTVMNPELSNFAEEIASLVAFVEGRIDADAMQALVHGDRMKALLMALQNPHHKAGTDYYVQISAYLEDHSLGGRVNAEGVVAIFLEQAEVAFKRVLPYGALYGLLLSAQPRYLDLPTDFLLEHVVPKDESLSKAKKIALIKERLKALFQYAKKPPSWVQSPAWPIHDGEPAYFIGQTPIDAPALFHDQGAAYVFFNKRSGQFETVTQFH